MNERIMMQKEKIYNIAHFCRTTIKPTSSCRCIWQLTVMRAWEQGSGELPFRGRRCLSRNEEREDKEGQGAVMARTHMLSIFTQPLRITQRSAELSLNNGSSTFCAPVVGGALLFHGWSLIFTVSHDHAVGERKGQTDPFWLLLCITMC